MSRICYLYGYTPQYVLYEMLASQSFAMLAEAEEWHRLERDELLNDMVSIQSIGIGDFEHYKQVASAFSSRLCPPVKPEKPVAPTVLPVESQDTMVAMKQIFSGLH